ncbi:MAG TPA: hypothetical protein PKA06_15085 [Gemmatales bacterium]|nr:hypothetical protein [Gemmatales bacterium]
MRPSHFIILLLCFDPCGQTGVFAQSSEAPNTSAQNTTHPAAQALLQSAIATLTRPEGVDVTFVQTIYGRTQPVVITGRSLTAAGKRSLVELHYQQNQRQATCKLYCDGENFHRVEQILGTTLRITYSMKELQEVLDKLASNEAERVAKEDVEKQQAGQHGFEGIAAQLKDLQRNMIFTAPVEVTLDLPGKPAQFLKKIEGQWNPATLEAFAPTKKSSDPRQQDFRYLWNERLDYLQFPRTAQIYFDAMGNFVRLELLGITERKGADKILASFDVTHLEFPSTLDQKWFQPTEEELKAKPTPIDLAAMVKTRHAQTMDMLKRLQQSESENR